MVYQFTVAFLRTLYLVRLDLALLKGNDIIFCKIAKKAARGITSHGAQLFPFCGHSLFDLIKVVSIAVLS